MTVSHSQSATVKVNQAGSLPPPSGSPPKTWISQPTVVMHGADLDHEHDRVADLQARVELAQAGDRAPARRTRRSNDARAAAVGLGHRGASLSSARLSSSTFTPGSPRTPSARPSVLLVDQLLHAVERDAAHLATRRAWMRAFACEMCGSTPEAEVVAASTGTSAAVRPGS